MEFNLAKQLKELRRMNGLTQQSLCDSIRISRSAYAYYESGKTEPNIKTLISLAAAYNITIEQLIGVTLKSEVNNTFKDSYNVDISFGELSDFEKQLVIKSRLMSAAQKDSLIEYIESNK